MRNFISYIIGLCGMIGWEYDVHFYYLLFMVSWIFITEYQVQKTNEKNKMYRYFMFGQTSIFIYLILEKFDGELLLSQFVISILFLVFVYTQNKGKKENKYKKHSNSYIVSFFMPLALPISLFYFWMLIFPSDYYNYFMILYILSIIKITNHYKSKIGHLYFYFSQIAVSLFLLQYSEIKWFIYVSFIIYLGLYQMKKNYERNKMSRM